MESVHAFPCQIHGLILIYHSICAEPVIEHGNIAKSGIGPSPNTSVMPSGSR